MVKIARKRSLYIQMVNELVKQQIFGTSKHAVKTHAIETARAAGLRGSEVWDAMNKAVFEAGIFSFETYANYKKVAKDFATFCKTQGIKDIERAKEKAPEYLKEGIESNKSAWTLKLERAALRKVFRDRELAKEVAIPMRMKEYITRSRNPMQDSKVYEKHKDIIDFARATGLRRRELESVRAKDVYEKDDRVYVHVRNGKGGKERNATVVAKYQNQVLKIVQNHKEEDNTKIFSQMPSIGLHVYRREYVRDRLEELRDRDKEQEKDKEREIERIREVSRDLGHGRTDVVITHYL